MPLQRIRRRLRLIRYYSADRPPGRWSRVLDVAVVAALLLAWPTTWVLDRFYVEESPPRTIEGKLFRDPGGTVWAWVSPPAFPPDRARGDAGFHGAFQVDVRTEDHGWPFASSRGPRVARMNLQLFDRRRSLGAGDLAEAAAERVALEEALVEWGHGQAAAALWPDGGGGGGAPLTHDARAWLANGLVWSVLLSIGAWLLVSVARLGAVATEAGGSVRRRRRYREDRCVNCGYDLRASTFSARCPECGTPL